jgi:hypothetical protein
MAETEDKAPNFNEQNEEGQGVFEKILKGNAINS